MTLSILANLAEGLENVGTAWNLGQWEMSFLLWLNNFHGTFLDKIFLIITLLGDKGIIWISSGILMLFFKKTRRIGISVIIAYAIVGGANNYIIKLLTNRARPFYDATIDVYPEAQSLQNFVAATFFGDGLFLGFGEIPDSTSFFSGHTVASFACATIILLNSRKIGIPAIVLASLIAFTRLWFGVHWPSDVIFGVVFGVGAATGLYYLIVFLEPKVLALIAKIFKKEPKAAA